MSLREKQQAFKEAAIIQAEMLYHYKLICRAIGLSEDQLKRYRKSDEDFADRLEQARTRFLNKRIKIAKPEFLLERLEPEIFKERKEVDSQHSGKVSFINDVPRPDKQ